MTAAESAERAQHYDPREIQEKWQARWAEMDLFRASDDPVWIAERHALTESSAASAQILRGAIAKLTQAAAGA